LKSSGFIATLLIAAKLYIQTDCRGYGSTGNGDIALYNALKKTMSRDYGVRCGKFPPDKEPAD
jgi:hypothetical protein